MTNTQSSYILIVGSGPSGLIAALTLLKNGVPVRIIEKASTFHTSQRGAGITPRSLEVYNFLGVTEIATLGELRKPVCNYELPGGRKPKIIMDMAPYREPTPDTPFMNPLLLGQHHSEEIFRSHLEKYGVHVELNTELVGFSQDLNGVTAQVVKRSGGSEVHETICTPFMIGADGARGFTRKGLGLTFAGVSRPTERFIIGDLLLKGLDTKYWHSWGEFGTTFVSLRPTEFQDRFFIITGGQGVDYKALLADRNALINFIIDTTGRDDFEFGEFIGISEYSPNIRMADRFSKGRIFIVGDAGHVHSPTGGQGMNSSIQDSFNLGWKLALVYKDQAPLSLLDSYNDERAPVIRQMLEQTTKLLNTAMDAKGNTTEALKASWERPKVLWQLGVNYRWSSIVVDEHRPYNPDHSQSALEAYGSQKDQTIHAGDRAPDAPGLTAPGVETTLFKIFRPHRHTVLLFYSSSADTKAVIDTLGTWFEGTLQLVIVLPKGSTPENIPGADIIVEDKLGHAYSAYESAVTNGSPVVLVRPDGVIGAIVSGVEGLRKYHKGIFSI